MAEDTSTKTTAKKPSRLGRALKFLALSAVLFPISGKINVPIPSGSGANSAVTKIVTADEDDEEQGELNTVLGTQTNQGLKYFVNDSAGGISGGLVVDGQRNFLLDPSETNPTIQAVFADPAERDFLRKTVTFFQPGLASEQVEQNIDSNQILVGDDIDIYLEQVRKGSWGTTLLQVNAEGKIKFNSISLRKFLIDANYQDTERHTLRRLVREEFFQSHQYHAIVSELYNQGYLDQVAGINTPHQVTQAVATGNMRAFLELFPQQKYMHDAGRGGNSYNFYVGEKLYAGDPTSQATIDQPYFAVVKFAEQNLDIRMGIDDFAKPQKIIELNNAFRSKYLDYYAQQGFAYEQIQIWNLVGMKRDNRANPENSLDMRAILPLPV